MKTEAGLGLLTVGAIAFLFLRGRGGAPAGEQGTLSTPSMEGVGAPALTGNIPLLKTVGITPTMAEEGVTEPRSFLGILSTRPDVVPLATYLEMPKEERRGYPLEQRPVIIPQVSAAAIQAQYPEGIPYDELAWFKSLTFKQQLELPWEQRQALTAQAAALKRESYRAWVDVGRPGAFEHEYPYWRP